MHRYWTKGQPERADCRLFIRVQGRALRVYREDEKECRCEESALSKQDSALCNQTSVCIVYLVFCCTARLSPPNLDILSMLRGSQVYDRTCQLFVSL